MQEEFLRTPNRAQGLIQVEPMNETTRQLKTSIEQQQFRKVCIPKRFLYFI